MFSYLLSENLNLFIERTNIPMIKKIKMLITQNYFFQSFNYLKYMILLSYIKLIVFVLSSDVLSDQNLKTYSFLTKRWAYSYIRGTGTREFCYLYLQYNIKSYHYKLKLLHIKLKNM